MISNKSTSKNIVWQLLRRNISAAQIIGYAAANLVGLAIIVTAIQFYCDASPDDAGSLSTDYLSVTKQVGFISQGGRNGFTGDEIRHLEAQPWVKKVRPFTASQFRVSAGVDFGGRSMGTMMFFEAIDDDMLDVKPDNWSFVPGENTEIPVILPKDYLALYNFGFAASQGMPQLSEDIVGAVPITLRLSGNGHSDVLRAYVAGFSSRINTVVVPDEFIRWANERYADTGMTNPERLMVEVASPGDPAIGTYLADHGLQAGGDKEASGRMAFFFTILTSIVIGVGAVICVLALFILMLSLHLILQKSRTQLRMLMLLGYSPTSVATYYYKLIISVNCVVLLVAVAAMSLCRMYWIQALETLGVEAGSISVSILTALTIMGVVTIINLVTIRHHMLRIWHNHG